MRSQEPMQIFLSTKLHRLLLHITTLQPNNFESTCTNAWDETTSKQENASHDLICYETDMRSAYPGECSRINSRPPDGEHHKEAGWCERNVLRDDGRDGSGMPK